MALEEASTTYQTTRREHGRLEDTMLTWNGHVKLVDFNRADLSSETDYIGDQVEDFLSRVFHRTLIPTPVRQLIDELQGETVPPHVFQKIEEAIVALNER